MKSYLDTEDTYYFNYEELIKAPKIITNLASIWFYSVLLCLLLPFSYNEKM